jgi:hypothetical protein
MRSDQWHQGPVGAHPFAGGCYSNAGWLSFEALEESYWKGARDASQARRDQPCDTSSTRGDGAARGSESQLAPHVQGTRCSARMTFLDPVERHARHPRLSI